MVSVAALQKTIWIDPERPAAAPANLRKDAQTARVRVRRHSPMPSATGNQRRDDRRMRNDASGASVFG
jgi:hypothetical protein